ncbi:MAG: hypothetical protein IJ723_01940 [Ruminococcus sp.]|nr:hypothetical protein [Ruminococcus sp.]
MCGLALLSPADKDEAYEEQKKADEEIRVGDEVAFHHTDGRPDTVVVITHVGTDGFIDGMNAKGDLYCDKDPTYWTKTGRHFPQVEELLAALGGAYNETN